MQTRSEVLGPYGLMINSPIVTSPIDSAEMPDSVSETLFENMEYYSDATLDIIFRFCLQENSEPFSAEELRRHLQINGVDCNDISEKEIYADIKFYRKDIASYLKDILDIEVEHVELDGQIAFAEVMSSLRASTSLGSVASEAASRPATGVEEDVWADDEPMDYTPEPGVVAEKHSEEVYLDQLQIVLSNYLRAKQAGIEGVQRDQVLKDLIGDHNVDGETIYVDEKTINNYITKLIERQNKIFGYRSGGKNSKSWLTLSKDCADSFRKKPNRNDSGSTVDLNERARQQEELIALGERIIWVFLEQSVHVQRLKTMREVFGLQQDSDAPFSREVSIRMNEAVRHMVRIGIMKREPRRVNRGQMSKSASNEVMTVGLVSQEIKDELAAIKEKEGSLLGHIEQLIGELEADR